MDPNLSLAEAWALFRRQAADHFAGTDDPPLILECWQRSRDNGAQRHEEKVLLHRIHSYDLEERLAATHRLQSVAVPILKELARGAHDIRHVVYLTDAEAIVLYSLGNATELLIQGRMPGYEWSEQTMGTNGAGTALATGRAVAVLGPVNYMLPYHAPVCFGAPLRSSAEKPIGAIVFSTNVHNATPSHLADLIASAAAIGKILQKAAARAARASDTRSA